MTENMKVDVVIGGRNFTVVGNESEEYIKNIAEYVDEKIKDVNGKNDKLSNSMAATLAAFNIADEFYRNYTEYTSLKEQVKEPLEKYEAMEKKLEKCRNRIEELEKQCTIYKNELSTTKKENEINSKTLKKYKQSIDFKEIELKQNQKMIKDLQDKVFENQIELVQTKKELKEALKHFDGEKDIFK